MEFSVAVSGDLACTSTIVSAPAEGFIPPGAADAPRCPCTAEPWGCSPASPGCCRVKGCGLSGFCSLAPVAGFTTYRFAILLVDLMGLSSISPKGPRAFRRVESSKPASLYRDSGTSTVLSSVGYLPSAGITLAKSSWLSATILAVLLIDWLPSFDVRVYSRAPAAGATATLSTFLIPCTLSATECALARLSAPVPPPVP